MDNNQEGEEKEEVDYKTMASIPQQHPHETSNVTMEGEDETSAIKRVKGKRNVSIHIDNPNMTWHLAAHTQPLAQHQSHFNKL